MFKDFKFKFFLLSICDRIAAIRIEINSNYYTVLTFTPPPHSVLTKQDPTVRDEFYNTLSDSLKARKTKGDNVLICGDFNSKVGKIEDHFEKECLGSFSKGTRNDNGTELLKFCLEQGLFIANSAFKHKSCHQTTWQGQIKKDNKIIKIYNQIDYILIPKYLKQNLSDARSFAGTLTNSDHRLVRVNIDFSSKHFKKTPLKRANVKFHTDRLQDENTKTKFQESCSKFLNQCKTNPSPQEGLENINSSLLKAANETILPINRKFGDRHCPEIEKLSNKQKEIRLLINNNPEPCQNLKAERNKIFKQIREKTLENANKRIDDLVDKIDNCATGSAQMFEAVKSIFRKPSRPIVVKNDEGALVDTDEEKLEILKHYYTDKYDGTAIEPLTKIGELNDPITSEEVSKAAASLSNNKAPGPDGIQVELLKSAPPSVIEELAEVFNGTFVQGQPINIGEGTLILLQKPGKPVGPPANLRPIVLLPAARKILSLITLNRIRDKAEEYISSSQAGFRRYRSTADIVWSHKWLISKIQKVQDEFTILGIDMSSAFDTINRIKLIEVCESFLDEDEVRLIRALLSNTSLELYCGPLSKSIPTLVGSPRVTGLAQHSSSFTSKLLLRR